MRAFAETGNEGLSLFEEARPVIKNRRSLPSLWPRELSLSALQAEWAAQQVAAFLNGAGLSTPVSQRVWARVGCVRAASSEGGVNTQRPQRSEDERC